MERDDQFNLAGPRFASQHIYSLWSMAMSALTVKDPGPGGPGGPGGP